MECILARSHHFELLLGGIQHVDGLQSAAELAHLCDRVDDHHNIPRHGPFLAFSP